MGELNYWILAIVTNIIFNFQVKGRPHIELIWVIFGLQVKDNLVFATNSNLYNTLRQVVNSNSW
jgi:hypothetical protein